MFFVGLLMLVFDGVVVVVEYFGMIEVVIYVVEIDIEL